MMRQKKKTREGHHAKYDPVEQKKHFFWKIESICSAVASTGVYEMIPVRDLNRMFKMRVLPIKMIPAPREKIPDEVLKMMRRYATGFLIEGKKGGYLAAEVEGGRLIVRTFLFLTNDGTPEGRKLRELCGLGRLDREFLAIDKLSTFMATDIKSDKVIDDNEGES